MSFVIEADLIETNLPAACCDGIFMRRVYHHFQHPARTDASILRALKPGGLVAVIDFAPRQGLPPVEGAPKNHAGHGVATNVLIEELHSRRLRNPHAGTELAGSRLLCNCSETGRT
jgi:SAM-dependent methyltransferase